MVVALSLFGLVYGFGFPAAALASATTASGGSSLITHYLVNPLPFDLLFWHVEAGIVMTFISFFHLGRHFNYYGNMLRGRTKAHVSRQTERARPAVAGRLTTESGEQGYAEPEGRPQPEARGRPAAT